MIIKNTKELFLDRNIDKDKKDIDLEKGDFTAILIAAFTTLFPALLAVFGFFAFVIFFLFMR